MSTNSRTFVCIRLDPSHPRVPSLLLTRLPARIKADEQRSIKCDKEKRELASVQTEMLGNLKKSLEVSEQSTRDARNRRDDPGSIELFEGLEQVARNEYKEYEAATKESRAYKAQTQASQSEQAKKDASVGASADGTSVDGKARKGSNANVKK